MRVAEEALLDERLEGVEVGRADLLCGLERAAAGEDGEPGEEALLRGRQQLVRPPDRGPERLLAGIGVSPALEQVEVP